MTRDIAHIRHQFPATQTQAYLNTGSTGPLSRAAADAIAQWNQKQLTGGRSNFSLFMETYLPMKEALRQQLARLFNASAEEVALTQHTTNGMNIATWGIDWHPGDEVVTASGEHPGALMPVYVAARRFNLKVRVVQQTLEDDDGALLEKFRRAITPRTRLVSVSHVSWKTGAVLPIAAIAEIAHRHGALIAVDGAQSGGALPLDVGEMNVDFYAIPGQKWLCGPEGTGALYVARDRIADLAPTFVGFSSLKDGGALDDGGHYLPAAGAKRYEMGTYYRPGLAGLQAGLAWFEELGCDWVAARIQQITCATRDMLDDLPHVTVVSPAQHAGLTSFRVDGVEPPAVVEQLAERNVVVRSVSDPDLVRVSTHFFNDESDIERLRQGLLSLRQ